VKAFWPLCISILVAGCGGGDDVLQPNCGDVGVAALTVTLLDACRLSASSYQQLLERLVRRSPSAELCVWAEPEHRRLKGDVFRAMQVYSVWPRALLSLC
jgi:hypothetical protein